MTDQDPSPWATDNVPVTSRVDEIVWDRDVPPDEAVPPPPPTGLAGRRNALLALGATAALAVAVGLLVAWPDTSSSSDSDEAADTQAEPTTTATLPAASPASTTTDLSQVDDEPPREILDESVILDIDIQQDGFALPFPEVIQEFTAETEMVALTDTGLLVTIGMPSGAVSSIALARESDFRRGEPGSIATSPDATFVSIEGNRMFLIPIGQEPIELDQNQFTNDETTNPAQIVSLGWLRLDDGATVFLVLVFDGLTGGQSEYLIALDGSVTPTNVGRAASFTVPLFSQGERFVNDSGGAYSVAVDGSAQRISSGDILATSREWRMVRECDATRLCQTVVERHDGTGRRTATLTNDYERVSFGAALSPDGTALAFTSNEFPSGRTIADLSDGTVQSFGNVSLSPLSSLSGAWAADSSGEFSIDNESGILFFDRDSGDVIRFAEELGGIVTLDVRHP